MAFSGTFNPGAATVAPRWAGPATGGDPIVDARELLRQAIRLPYEAARNREWLERFGECVTGARRALNRHVAKAAEPTSPINQLASEVPHLRQLASQQADEHPQLIAQARALSLEAAEAGAADIWRMIDLNEKATLLEIALARHHNRTVAMIYEATHRELGEAG